MAKGIKQPSLAAKIKNAFSKGLGLKQSKSGAKFVAGGKKGKIKDITVKNRKPMVKVTATKTPVKQLKNKAIAAKKGGKFKAFIG